MDWEKEFEEVYKIRKEKPFDSHKDTAREFWLAAIKKALERTLKNLEKLK